MMPSFKTMQTFQVCNACRKDVMKPFGSGAEAQSFADGINEHFLNVYASLVELEKGKFYEFRGRERKPLDSVYLKVAS
jgi:hypothetical protein